MSVTSVVDKVLTTIEIADKDMNNTELGEYASKLDVLLSVLGDEVEGYLRGESPYIVTAAVFLGLAAATIATGGVAAPIVSTLASLIVDSLAFANVLGAPQVFNTLNKGREIIGSISTSAAPDASYAYSDTYSGPDGTGTLENEDIEYADGTSKLETYFRFAHG